MYTDARDLSVLIDIDLYCDSIVDDDMPVWPPFNTADPSGSSITAMEFKRSVRGRIPVVAAVCGKNRRTRKRYVKWATLEGFIILFPNIEGRGQEIREMHQERLLKSGTRYVLHVARPDDPDTKELPGEWETWV